MEEVPLFGPFQVYRTGSLCSYNINGNLTQITHPLGSLQYLLPNESFTFNRVEDVVHGSTTKLLAAH
jgi:hypothetical protein